MRALFVLMSQLRYHCFSFFFFNDTATTEIYTLSLHDALPIYGLRRDAEATERQLQAQKQKLKDAQRQLSALKVDRKSTRPNSSHSQISYAVFCLKKKKKKKIEKKKTNNNN